MDYKSIISRSLKAENRINLSGYLMREFKKAEKDFFYEFEDFFNGFLFLLNKEKLFIENKFEIYLKDLKDTISKLENDELSFSNSYHQNCIDKNEGLTYNEYYLLQKEKNIKFYKESLKTANIYDGKALGSDFNLKIIENLLIIINELLVSNNETCNMSIDHTQLVLELPNHASKYYAVFHYLRSLNDEKYILTRNSDDKFKAQELQLWFSELYPERSSQGIYRNLLLIKDSTNELHGFIKRSLSGERTWKSKVREIANYFCDNKVISELDSY